MSSTITDAEISAIRSSVDYTAISDNIVHVADFVIEKHEFELGTPLPSSVRDAALVEIRRALWELMDRIRAGHKKLVREMITIADQAVADAAGK